jgi:holo-[acyl-carrier protein] synthase|tara:strand:- start:190 stop:570 length:381 start_codon:yes stop_codon:yes gene_type:complete
MKGIGSDLIDIRRIDKTIARFGDRFKKRIFTDNEIKKCEKRKQSVSCYAKRFAAKEAAAKALGTGFRKGVYWRDIEIVNEPSGKPTLEFHGKSKLHLLNLVLDNDYTINLSITDEFPYAQAIVTIN